MFRLRCALALVCALASAATEARADATVGTGNAASCTEDAFAAALSAGGLVTFACGDLPVVVSLASPHPIVADTVIDGAGCVTLGGVGSTLLDVPEGRSLTVRPVT